MRHHRPKKRESNGKLYLDSYSALADFLRHRPRAIRAVYCKDPQQPKLAQLLTEHPHVRVEPLTALPDGEGFGGSFYAEVDLAPLPEADFWRRLAGRSSDLIVALDHITDPRNLGAIARSAAFFGVRELIVAKDRQVLLTRSAVATAQAAFALTDLVMVTNLGRSLMQLKEEGYWVVGASMEGEGLEAVAGQYEKLVLVLGAEDKGLSPGIKSKCDRLVSIGGAAARLDSLNVAVAAGILLRGLFSAKNGNP